MPETIATLTTTDPAGMRARPPWHRWLALALGVCLLLGAVRWTDAWADRQLEASVKRASVAFVSVRGVEAVLEELQSVKVGGSLLFRVEGAPFAWLHPVVEVAERIGSLLFAGLVVLEGLRLLGELAASGPFTAALAVAALAVAALATAWPLAAAGLWRLLGVGLVLRLALLAVALALWPAQAVLQQRSDTFQHHLKDVPLPRWGQAMESVRTWGPLRGQEGAADRPAAGAEAARGWSDALVADLLVLAAALFCELIVLPLLALVGLRWAVAGLLVSGRPRC